MLTKEVAVENFTNIPKAIQKGANRIELNDNLAVGGTTVSKGVMVESIHYAQDHNVPIFTMIRPRGGNFEYNDIELKIMETDIFEAQAYAADGIAVGALRPDHWLDEEALEQLFAAAGGMEITFHMAFDEIPENRQKQAIDWLSDQGVTRILTHGGPLSEPLNINHLKQLINYAKGRIQILPGGGITDKNADEIAKELGVHELHGTKIVGNLN